MRRTGVCGAMETLLIDAAFPEAAALLGALLDAGCELRGDARAQAIDPRVIAAERDDWDTEYLDAMLSVAVVDGLDAAIAHIAAHGSHHTDAIVTEDAAVAERFLAEVDSAIVMHNASTPVRRRRRVRAGRGDRHRHRPAPRARAGGARRADDLQVAGARHRARSAA